MLENTKDLKAIGYVVSDSAIETAVASIDLRELHVHHFQNNEQFNRLALLQEVNMIDHIPHFSQDLVSLDLDDQFLFQHHLLNCSNVVRHYLCSLLLEFLPPVASNFDHVLSD